jgi:hypothetical protein
MIPTSPTDFAICLNFADCLIASGTVFSGSSVDSRRTAIRTLEANLYWLRHHQPLDMPIRSASGRGKVRSASVRSRVTKCSYAKSRRSPLT